MKILDFIFCDDVRQEISNKYTLVGTYNDLLQLQTKSIESLKLPIVFRMAFFLRLDLQGNTDLKTIDFKLSGDCIDEVAGGIFIQSLNEPNRPLIVAATGFAITIKSQGIIDVEFSCKDLNGRVIEILKPSHDFCIEFKELQ